MLFKVYTNRVNLLDDDGNIIAGVDFSKNEKGICELGNVYKNQPISEKLENKLMSHAISRIRSLNEHVVPAGQDARDWFEAHPEDQDLLDMAGSVVTEEEIIQSQPISTDDNGHDVNFQQLVDDATAAGKEAIKNQKSTALQSFGHFMQAVCFVCMAGIVVLYAQNAYAYMQFIQIMMQSQSIYQMTFFGCLVGFGVWCIIQCFWIMSKKTYIVNNEKVKVDAGRGIVGFALVLIVYLISRFMYNTYGLVNQGIVQWLGFFIVNVTYMPYLSGIGLALSILRKIIGRA